MLIGPGLEEVKEAGQDWAAALNQFAIRHGDRIQF